MGSETDALLKCAGNSGDSLLISEAFRVANQKLSSYFAGQRITGMAKRKRGRPKKDSLEGWQFARAALVMCIYDEVRISDQKHSVAIREVVDSFMRICPEMPISQSEVKRILSEFRPRGSGKILVFERSLLSEADIQRHRWMREQISQLEEKKGLTLPPRLTSDETRQREKFTIRFAERPDYPRHNRKIVSPRTNSPSC